MVEIGEVFALDAQGCRTAQCLGVNRGARPGEVVCSFSDGTMSLYDVSRSQDGCNRDCAS